MSHYLCIFISVFLCVLHNKVPENGQNRVHLLVSGKSEPTVEFVAEKYLKWTYNMPRAIFASKSGPTPPGQPDFGHTDLKIEITPENGEV